MATSEGIPSSIDIEFLELNDNPYFIYHICCLFLAKKRSKIPFYKVGTHEMVKNALEV